jgi:hypothetical protein
MQALRPQARVAFLIRAASPSPPAILIDRDQRVDQPPQLGVGEPPCSTRALPWSWLRSVPSGCDGVLRLSLRS